MIFFLSKLHFGGYLIIYRRLPVFETEVLKLTFYGIQTYPVCKRSVQEDGLAGHLHLFVFGHRFKSPHVMKPVGYLDKNYPQIVRQGQKHSAEVLCLKR